MIAVAASYQNGGGRWTAVAWSMGVGAVYDLLFALAILFWTRPAAALLDLDVPDDPVYLRFNGVFLILIAGLYLLPAISPARYQGVVVVASFGRLLGFIYLGLVWWSGGAQAFGGLALADLAFAVIHGILLVSARAQIDRD